MSCALTACGSARPQSAGQLAPITHVPTVAPSPRGPSPGGPSVVVPPGPVPTPAAASVSDGPWLPLARPALAYQASSGVWVVGAGGRPILLGGPAIGGDANVAWSRDGRFLAWGTHGSAPVDGPPDEGVTILDTATGRRATVDSHGVLLDGGVFAVPGSFVLGVSGDDDLGDGAGKLLVVDPAGGLDALRTRLVQTDLAADCRRDDSAGEGCETHWTQAVGDRLVAVVTVASGTYYRPSAHVYSVGLGGDARLLFGPARDDGHNNGVPGLAYSPDGTRSAVFDSYRNGGETYDHLLVGGAAGRPATRPAGLPAYPADGSVTELGRLSWTPGGDLLVNLGRVRTLATTRPDPPSGTDELYRCPGGSDCEPTGLIAAGAVEAADGSLALLRPGPDSRQPFDGQTLLLLRAGRPEQRLDGYAPTWSPS